MSVSLSLWALILAFILPPIVTCHVPYAMCNAVPVGHLVVLFAVMIRARVHPNDQEFIPSMLISGLSIKTFQ